MATMTFKAILPGKFREDVFMPEFMAGMLDTNKAIRKDFDRTVKTFETKVDFDADTVAGSTKITTEVYTKNRIYRFVNNGTDHRHAVMSMDYIPKTIPNIIDAGRGRGRLRYVSKKVNKPGIQARNFDLAIAKQQEKPFRERMTEAMRRGAKKCGHAM